MAGPGWETVERFGPAAGDRVPLSRPQGDMPIFAPNSGSSGAHGKKFMGE